MNTSNATEMEAELTKFGKEKVMLSFTGTTFFFFFFCFFGCTVQHVGS